MHDFLEENLVVLRQHHPHAAHVLESTGPVSAAGFSSTGPFPEGPIEGAVVLLGMGTPNFLPDLWREHGETIELLVVLEPDISRAKAVLSDTSLTSILADERFRFFVGTSPEDVRLAFKPLRYELGNVVPTVVDLRPVSDHFRSIVEQELLLLRQNAELIISEKGRMLFNCLRNLPVILTAAPVQTLEGRCKGEAAFVVAAGPSLDKNIAQLATARNHGWVIAADTAFGPLRNAGIEPHFVVTFDPSPLNERHFSGWPPMGQAILAFHPEVCAEIPRNYFGKSRTLVLHDGESRLLCELGLSPMPGHGLARGMMTGHLAFNLAVYLGCDPIVLVGMDLAFPDTGKSTHATGTRLARQVTGRQGLKASVGPISEHLPGFETDIIEMPGMYGGSVYGPPVFGTYLRIMEQEIARSGRRVIDATEGGTRKEGTEVVQLSEAIQKAAEETGPVNSRPRSEHAYDIPPLESILSVLSEGRTRLIDLKQWAAEPHGMTEWKERLTQNLDDWLMPVYEALIYKLYDISPTGADTERKLDDVAKELRSSCEHFNLFIQGAEQEIRTLYDRLGNPQNFK